MTECMLEPQKGKFAFAESLRKRMTPVETKLWEYLRTKPNGIKFRRQHPFNQYILDFYCHKAKLVIEIDGVYHNASEQKEYDEDRTSIIEDYGLKEIRFTNNEVLYSFEKVVGEIMSQVENSLP